MSATLSPVVPLLIFALLVLTVSWASNVMSIFFPSPSTPKVELEAKAKKGKKKEAAPVPAAITAATPPPSYNKAIFLLVAWAGMFYLLMSGAFGFAEDRTLFDPYRILNITSGATKSEVKKVFRTLSMDLHPDRMQGKSEEEKTLAEAQFVLISKAYKTLTDDEAWKNYIEYGHPDGPRTNSISFGIPEWMLEKENESLVMLGYLAFFSLLGVGIWKKVAHLLQVEEEIEEEEASSKKKIGKPKTY